LDARAFKKHIKDREALTTDYIMQIDKTVINNIRKK
jgi:hypothetical protein